MKSIFVAAIRIADPRERAAYLDDACCGDGRLRETVERLLAARDQSESNPLDRALEDMRPDKTAGLEMCSGEDIEVAEHPLIGCYKILERLGEGGMGVVYMAEQQDPVRRTVALKVIKPGMDTRVVVARFQAERQALAMMEHPHIAKVFDAGTTPDNRPYFVMELVRGVAITEFCDRQRLNARERLELLIKVCWAVQHTHQKGIIHRDLKPSNVMVEMHNTQPVPKIIDFGVAKATQQPLTDETLFTRFVQMIGTPLYMSPEQAELNALDVDTRSDVYSLGVLLYELLTGQTPFDRERMRAVGYDELRRIIRFEEPPRPSTRLSTLTAGQRNTLEQIHGAAAPQIVRRLRGELDWIVMKALEKDRTRRYESAAALAHDLESYLNGDPVSARPPSIVYQAGKFARRHKGMLAGTVMVLAALLLGTAASLWYAWQTNAALGLADQRLAVSNAALATAQRARGEAEAATRRARLLLYLADMKLASDAYQIGDIPRVVALLQRHVPRPGEEDLRGFEWHYLHRLVDVRPLWKRDVPAPVNGIRHAPGGDRLATAAGDGRIRVLESRSGRLLRTYLSPAGTNDVAWSPSGDRLACAATDGYLRVWDAPREIAASADGEPSTGILIDIATVVLNRPDLAWKAHEGEANAVRFAPHGRTLASCGDDGTICIWHAATGQPLKTLEGHGREVEAIAWSPDGGLLASASSDETIAIWDLQTGEQRHRWKLEAGGGRMVAVAFSADGSLVAAGDINGNLVVVDRASAAMATARQLDGIESLLFLGREHRVATGDRSGAIHVWSVVANEGEPLRLAPAEALHWRAHAGRVQALSDSPHADAVVSGSRDGEIASWLPPHPAAWYADCEGEDLAVDARGSLYVCSHEVQRYDLAGQRWMAAMAPNRAVWEIVAATQDGDRIAAAAVGSVAVFDSAGRAKRAEWEIDQDPNAIAISPAGDWLAVAWWDRDATIDLFSPQDPKQPWRLAARQCECLAFSPNGRKLAAGSMDDLLVFDVSTRQLQQRLVGHDSTLSDVAFHPGGHTIATVSHDRRLKLWNAVSGELVHSVEAHRQRVRSVAFSQDGRAVATCSDDGHVRLWHAETAQPLLSIPVGPPLRKARFADGGRQLVVQLQDRRILIYGAPKRSRGDQQRAVPNAAAELLGLGLAPAGDDFPPLAVSADGQAVVGNRLMDNRSVPFRWTADTGVRLLPVPEGYRQADVISADPACQVVAGRFVRQDGATLMGRWPGEGQPPEIQPLPEGWRQIRLQQDCGSRAVGYGFKVGGQERCAFAADENGFRELPAFGPRKNAAAASVSQDGGLVIGTSWSRNGPSRSGVTGDLCVVRWRDGAGELLPGFGPEAYNWRATAATPDGTVVIGHRWPVGTSPLDGAGLAFRWQNGTAETLGELLGGGLQSVAYAISADGRRVVGSSWTESGQTAFVWDREHGMRRLEDVLRQQRADVRGWHLAYALALSAGGTHIAGHGRNPAGDPEIFLARIASD